MKDFGSDIVQNTKDSAGTWVRCVAGVCQILLLLAGVLNSGAKTGWQQCLRGVVLVTQVLGICLGVI
jgi:hypothetical protein